MTEMILAQVSYGGYISPIKLAGFVVLIFAWLPLVSWVYIDTQEVRTKKEFWTGLNFGLPAAAAILWFLIPFYLIGILLFIISVLAVFITYVMHRNSLVADFERVLTISHIKGLISNEQKKAQKAVKGLGFVTANGNPVDVPQAKSPDFYGFKVLEDIIDDAIWKRASDISFIPGREEYNVFYKIDGLQIKQEPQSAEEMDYFIRFLKLLADLDINERRKPQTGKFKVKKDNDSYEFIVNTAGSTAGEKILIRRVEEKGLIKLNDLGFTSKQIEEINKFKETDGGIFIISGPPGSGVSTTFYACIKNHDPFMNNINTIEKEQGKPIQNVTQIYYKLSDTGTTTYARRIQSMFRTGPDIVGVADCEDQETAKVLTETLAKDKKVTYVSFTAPSVIQALAKWMKLVPDRNLAIDLLYGISCQRLVRRLCKECREAYQPNREVFKKFNLPADKIKTLYRKGEIEYDKHGKPIVCENCQGTGFVDRVGIYETAFLSPELREQIKEAKSLQEISTLLRKAKMLYLQEQAIRKVAEGVTSINEIIREFSPKSGEKRTTDNK